MKMLDYTLSGGHRDQLLVLSEMYQDLMVNKELRAENIKQAYLLGWSMEIVSFLLATIGWTLSTQNYFHQW